MNEEKAKKELGLRVKSFRKEHKYTQDQLISIIGLEQANLSNIENGKNFPDITTLCALIEKAGIEPNYLFGFLEIKNQNYSSLDIEILSIIIDLKTDAKECLKNFLLSMKK